MEEEEEEEPHLCWQWSHHLQLWQNRLMQFWDIKTFIFFPHKWLDLILKIFFVDCPQGDFADDGTETHFMVGEHECCIKATSSGKKKNGIVHYLLLDGEKIPASTQ